MNPPERQVRPGPMAAFLRREVTADEALAAAPPARRLLTFPRGDLRSNRRALPSRWLLDTATALAGRRVHATDFDELDSDVLAHVGSFATGIRKGAAGSLGERDLGCNRAGCHTSGFRIR